jgi:hypothetical protein
LADDPHRAQSFFDEFLALDPDPLNYPFAYYHLAECCRRMGDPTGASEYDLKAASTHFGTR